MTGVPLLNLARPPFRLVAHQSTESAAADMLAAYTVITKLPNKLSRSFDAVARCTGAREETPLIVAGRRLAEVIDNGVGAGHRNAYHNVQHFCEVMLGAYFLSLLADLDKNSRLEVVLAALIHDFHHDGTVNGPIPFRLERKAVNESTPHLVDAGVSELQRRHIAALVLATEMVHGRAIAHACHEHHVRASPRPEIHIAAPELAELAEDPIVARQALIIREADVLPSVGLSLEHALQLQDRLSIEWGVPLSPEDKLRFITKTFPGFIIGTFFQPNVERIRLSLLQRPNDAAG